MNIKELFDKAENGTLTWTQFEALAKADGAKFVDLKEGGYVSKSKYDDDLKSKESSIEQLNSTISQRDADLNNLKTQLASAGTDAEKLSKLETDFGALQNKYTADMEAYQQQLASQRYEFAVKEFANSKKFTSNAAKRDFTTAMIGANLKFDADKGKILGAEDFVTSYSEDNEDAFAKETEGGQTPPATPAPQPVKPTFAGPTSGTGSIDSNNNSNLFGFNFTPVRPGKKD